MAIFRFQNQNGIEVGDIKIGNHIMKTEWTRISKNRFVLRLFLVRKPIVRMLTKIGDCI